MATHDSVTAPILTSRQRDFLRAYAASCLSQSFVLSGGTALAAYYFRHRVSDDLDFFTEDAVDLNAVRAFLMGLPFIDHHTEQHLYDRNLFLITMKSGDTLKVEFTRYPFPRLAPSEMREGVSVDSLRDIGANKVAAFADRADAKDAFDLYTFLERGTPFDAMVADAETKFGIAGLRHTLEPRLLAVAQIVDWPKPTVPFDPAALVTRYRDLARTLVRRDIRE